jgi:poly(hydroxyalkanoate) depolymerase family esterase
MTSKFAAAMRRATAATRALNVFGATKIIQRSLAKRMFSTLAESVLKPAVKTRQGSQKTTVSRTSVASAKLAKPQSVKPAAIKKGPDAAQTLARPAKLPKRPLGEVLASLKQLAVPPSSSRPFGLMSSGHTGKVPNLPMPDGAKFASRSFTCNAGTRKFKLYIPASTVGKPKGLIIMLHGCTQNPDDFAAGTNMNSLAEAHGLLIAYPAQTQSSNASSCWNWFDERHQARDAGEPAILAGLTRKLIAEFAIDHDQVFIAGLSAGAAMAVIMGKTYPDLFHAVGVHSGLAYQSAGNVMSAMAVMRGSSGSQLFGQVPSQDKTTSAVRTIIFHGAADRTVHPSNAQRIFDTAYDASNHGTPKTTTGTRNGRSFKRTVIAASKGSPVIESWLIDGADHAWSGGKASGSYADPKGPDASAEMVLFFLNRK